MFSLAVFRGSISGWGMCSEGGQLSYVGARTCQNLENRKVVTDWSAEINLLCNDCTHCGLVQLVEIQPLLPFIVVLVHVATVYLSLLPYFSVNKIIDNLSTFCAEQFFRLNRPFPRSQFAVRPSLYSFKKCFLYYTLSDDHNNHNYIDKTVRSSCNVV